MKLSSLFTLTVLTFSYFDCLSTKKITKVAQVAQAVQHQAPPVACPRDTSPYVVDSKLKECKPGKAADCPSGFICYFDGVQERYICCGKTPGYCEAGQPFTNPVSRQPQECQTDGDATCKTPYRCESRNTGSRVGFCCLNLEGIEPPPIGCPWGTRPLRNINQVIVTCVPGTTNACPGDAICYFDSVERSNKCCGRDPGEGCPSGTRAFKTNNQIVSCTPGERTQECPANAVCQWSYLIDRFQCCQADNGCPSDMTPLMGLNNVVQTCVRDQASSCPQQYSCEFNFWIASYQCCGRMSGFCPVGQVTYLESGTNQVRTCIQTQPGICPTGYSCQQSTTGQFICCGLAGQCPSGLQLATDSQGRAQSCSPGVTSSCPSTATCLAALGGASGQYLCCSTGGSNQCPSGFSLQNGQVTQCNPSVPTSCFSGSICTQSLIQTGFYLCCSSGTSSQCPTGYQPLNNQVISCNPSSPTACFSNSQCLGSVSQPGSYLCCSLTSSTTQCPIGYTLQNNQLTQCNPSNPSNCFSGSSCLQSPSQPGLYICCSFGTSSQCPSGYQPLNNQVISCNPSSPTNCFSGSQCLGSLTQPGTYLCCSATGSSQCPAGYNLQNNQITQCNPSSPSNCFSGSLCLQSPASSNLFLCCVSTVSNTLQCPTGYTPQNNIVTPCTSNTNCAIGNLCLQSPAQPGTSICCMTQISNSPCPAGTRLQNGVTISCNTFTTVTSCSSGSFCLNSILTPNSQLCCTIDNPNTIQCPQGYQLQNNVPAQCNPNSVGSCFSGSSCLISPSMSGVYVCCSQLSGSLQCPSGYNLQNGQVTSCTPSLSTCLTGSFCLAAPTQPNLFICCTQGVGGNSCPSGFTLQGGIATFCNPLQPNCATPGAQCLASPGSTNSVCCIASSSQYQCPNNLQPYMVGTNFYFCTQSAPNCPAGSTCQQATNVAGLFLCCQGSTELQYQCPANSRPLMTGASFTFCNPNSGPFCPATYSCQQAVNTPNTFICCSTSTLSPTCPSGLNPYTTTPGQFVYCSATNTNCPTGSSCQIATNMANTYVCCSSATTYTCPGNFQIFIGGTGQVTVCTGSPNICPQPSTCLQATNNIQVSVCCQTSTSNQFCPANQQDLYANGQLQYCTGVGAVCPQTGYTCQFSTSLNQYLCCGSGATTDICPTGQQPLYIGTAIQFCTNPGSTCPSAGYSCQFSNFISRFVCCGGTSLSLRCLNNQPMYQPSSTPFICNPQDSRCPAQYDCLQSTQAQFVCCLRAGSSGSYQCVSGRVPYPNSAYAQICNPTSSNCPAATACEQSNLPNQFICCNLGTRQPQCPSTWQPLLDGVIPRRCSGPSDTSCPSPYSCLASDITSTYICCQFSSGLTCFTGAQPFILSNGQPQQCSIASPNCPPNFSCQSSTQSGILICCGASFQGNIFCPDGNQPYRVGSQPFYCGPTATCPQTYQCVQSSSPSYQVCCLQTQPSSVCLPGQQPYLVNNQPQTCRIANPQCQQGYICQQATSGVYYCCQNPTCSNGITLLSTNGQPRYCNPASSSCPMDATCQQSLNLPGNFICCISSTLQPGTLTRCVGRTTYLPTGISVPCSLTPNSCPSGNECSSFTTTGSSICCVSTPADQSDPICPSGEPFKDAATKQYHYCSSTNYVCPQGFVCKQMINNIATPNQYLCCSSKTTCQFGWAPYVDRTTNLPVDCNPSNANSCNVAGAPYKCQQSTTPGEYLCCMETMIAFVEEEDNSTITSKVATITRKSTRSPSAAQKMIKWIFG